MNAQGYRTRCAACSRSRAYDNIRSLAQKKTCCTCVNIYIHMVRECACASCVNNARITSVSAHQHASAVSRSGLRYISFATADTTRTSIAVRGCCAKKHVRRFPAISCLSVIFACLPCLLTYIFGTHYTHISSAHIKTISNAK